MKLKIAFCGQPEYFRIHYKDLLESSVYDCVEVPISIGRPEDYSKLLGENYDIVFFFRGEFCPKEVFDKIKGVKVEISSEPFPKIIDGELIASRELDDRFNIFKRIKELNFDYIFHYDKTSINFIRYNEIKCDGEFYLPISKKSEEPPMINSSWDVCFVGRDNSYRESILGGIKRDFKTVHLCHGVNDELLQSICQNSKVVLNLNTERIPSLNPRLQQMLSYGCFVISDANTHEGMFEEGMDYIFSEPLDFYEKIEYYLKNPDVARRISKNGYEKVRRELDSIECWTELIERVRRK